LTNGGSGGWGIKANITTAVTSSQPTACHSRENFRLWYSVSGKVNCVLLKPIDPAGG
jgi:hypothetical protein